MASNGNAVWKNPSMTIEELPEPKLGHDDVVVRVKYCGVCGSDVHMYEVDTDGYILFPGSCKFPLITGHEFSGVIEEAGRDVQDLVPGDMVAVEATNWCGVCDPCRAGMLNQCVRLRETGFTLNGAFAEFVLTKPQYCWRINSLKERYREEDLVYRAGALVEPTSIAYNGMFVSAGGFRSGGHVAVFGTGPVGLAAVALAKAAGTATIIAFNTSAPRRELALSVGADYVFDPSAIATKGSTPAEVILELTGGVGLAMAVEAAGSSRRTVPQIERSLAVDGKIVALGMAAEDTPIDFLIYQSKSGHLHGSIRHSGHGIFPSVIRLMAAGRIDMTRLVSGVFPLDRAVEAIEHTAKKEGGKFLVQP